MPTEIPRQPTPTEPTPTERFETLRSVLASTFETPAGAITPSTGQEDLEGWDSLGHLNLMLALQDTFGVTLDVDDMLELTSVPAILEFLDRAPAS
ncbi:MAG: acyl carrier protein [Acidimicrobiia bacterium]|nr:acyl carrier protein [Acidimicrobiia bacterium]